MGNVPKQLEQDKKSDTSGFRSLVPFRKSHQLPCDSNSDPAPPPDPMHNTISSSLLLLLKWIVVHTLSITLTAAITFSIVFSNHVGEMIALIAFSGVISGLFVGGTEAWLLQPLLSQKVGLWVLIAMVVTPVGLAGGGLLTLGIASLFSRSVGVTAGKIIAFGAFGFGIGAVLGVAQWTLLRRVFRHAWIWIAAVTAGRTIGWSISLTLAPQLAPNNLLLSAGLSGAIGGLLYGAITGLCLIWLTTHYRHDRNLLHSKAADEDKEHTKNTTFSSQVP